jgi:hypothetical protein
MNKQRSPCSLPALLLPVLSFAAYILIVAYSLIPQGVDADIV